MNDIQLQDIGTTMTNVHLKIMPPTADYKDLELELFFDDNEVIVLEMHDLIITGAGMVTDPENGNLEIIQFQGPLSTGNIIIKPEEVIKPNGDMYPKFTIEEVTLILDEPNISMVVHG